MQLQRKQNYGLTFYTHYEILCKTDSEMNGKSINAVNFSTVGYIYIIYIIIYIYIYIILCHFLPIDFKAILLLFQ
jgi:hypothetical protein